VIRWLGQLPAEVLFPVFAIVGLGLTFLFDQLVRRYVSEETRHRATATAAVTLQVTATIYAILIAFVIVDEYTQLRSAQGDISAKASALAVIDESSRALPQAVSDSIRTETLAYARTIVQESIPRFEKRAVPDPRADRLLERVYRTVQSYEPKTQSEIAAARAISDSLNDVVSTRAGLIDDARSTVPAALFWLLLVIGMVVMAIATMLDTQHRQSHLIILSGLALVIWLTLALVVSMDYVFGGIIGVDSGPLRTFIHFRAAR